MLASLLLAALTQTPAVSVAPIPADPVWIESGDLDGDGAADLVVAHGLPRSLSILLGTGSGGFGAPIAVPTNGRPTALTLGDLDADGDLDTVVSQRGNDRVQVFRGNGAGGLVPALSVDVLTAPHGLALAQLDGDGDLDLVVGHGNAPGGSTGLVEVLLGSAGISFVPAGAYSAGDAPYQVKTADVDGDGFVDVVAAHELPVFSSGESFVDVLYGAGDGTLAPGPSPHLSGEADAAAVADVDLDGDLDIAATSWDLGKVLGELKLQGAGGSFSTTKYFDSGGGRWMEFADLDLDGDPDLVGLRLGGGLTITLNGGVEGPFFGASEVWGAAYDLAHFAFVDQDADGRQDVAAVASSGQLVLFENPFPLCPAPAITSVEPPTVPVLSAYGFSMELVGCFPQTPLLSVELDGAPLPPDVTVTELGGKVVLGKLPTTYAAGAHQLELAYASGSVFAQFEAVLPASPLLLVEGAGDGVLPLNGVLQLAVAAQPGDVVVLLLSGSPYPLSLPGIIELDMGSGVNALFLLTALPVPVAGWTGLAIPYSGFSPWFQIYLQGAVLQGGALVLPIPTTNSVGIQFAF